MTQVEVGATQVAELEQAMLGPVLVAGDAGYDEVRLGWNGRFDRRPGLIARCMGVADVQAALAFARTNDLPLVVRGGGHSNQGLSTIDGGMLLDLSLMRAVHVDPQRRTAVVAGGTQWAEFDRETLAHGLAATGGMVSHTGVAGLTLGGGVGRFMRKRGLTIDHVIALDVVTADGRWIRVDNDSHSDLFWALRGGGGTLGVVTHFHFVLHPLPAIVYSGALGWPLAQTREVFAAMREEIDGAPEEFSLQFMVTNAPELEFIPEAIRGKPALLLTATWMGEDLAEGERHLAPFRTKVAPTLDMVGPAPYTFLQAASDPLVPHGRRSFTLSGFLDDLTDEILDVVLARCSPFPSQHAIVELYPLGGAIARVPEDATAASGFRDAGWYYNVAANAPEPSADEFCRQWVLDTDAALASVRRPGRYVNFILEDDDPTLREAYGTRKYERLAQVRATYDPDGVFTRRA